MIDVKNPNTGARLETLTESKLQVPKISWGFMTLSSCLLQSAPRSFNIRELPGVLPDIVI